MSWKNKVVWSEGLFLKPQHFQQQVRYFESYLEGRNGGLRPYPWGFSELSVDTDLLKVGKLAISSGRGVFPDGTPFNIPEDDEPPPPMDVPEDARDMIVYLGLPTRRPGSQAIHFAEGDEGLARYLPREIDVRDETAATEGTATMQVGTLRLRLLLDRDTRDDYACLGLTEIIECRSDKNVLLQDRFIPPVLDCHASARLAGFLSELQGLLHHRGEAIASRVAETGRGGAAEIADFLMLQAVNRYEPLVAHLNRTFNYHAEDFYRLCVSMAGELSTFFAATKRPPEFAEYRHEDLRASFDPVIRSLRDSFSMQVEQMAIPIPMKERKYGIRVAQVEDRSLLDYALFVLAVNADTPTEDIRKLFPSQIKIGSVEKIRDLVNLQLPGILLRPIPVAPRQIPYHAGSVYFELDKANEYWPLLKESGGIAMHIGGDFPGLKLEFWAIKG